MNPKSTAWVMERTSDIIRDTLTKGGDVVVCGVTENGTAFTTRYAGLVSPVSLTHLALTLLHHAKDSLVSRMKSTPPNQDDEAIFTDLADITNNLKSYTDPEASA